MIIPSGERFTGNEVIDALVVGAGPTGLTVAAQLQRFGVRFRIIDRLVDRGRESRALAVQARSLEIFQSLGIAEALVSRGRETARLMIHIDAQAPVEIRLGEVKAADTRFPFILFVSQAETEAVLLDYLRSAAVTIERGVELTTAQAGPQHVTCVLRHPDGRNEQLDAKYVLGCDGAHSTVRKLAGIPFEGDTYPQDFLLGDVEVDGPLERDAIHSFPRGGGIALFFPLGQPRSWRVIAMSSENDEPSEINPTTTDSSLSELQSIVSAATDETLRLHDPAWVTHFRLHHRQTRRYRAGPLFLAGDAAHVHSPVGAQGMNTGIQDAWNLGWKIALVAQRVAVPELLDSYDAERWPVGRFLLRVTDRLFTLITRVTSAGTLIDWVRRSIVPKVLVRVARSTRLRDFGFRFVSELDIRYRSSRVVQEGDPRLQRGPRAGDRLPDAPVLRDGREVYLQDAVSAPSFHLLLCGPTQSWNTEACVELSRRDRRPVTLHYLTRQPTPGALVDERGHAFTLLAVDDAAQYLIRPDGHIAYRCAGSDLRGVAGYLDRWLPSQAG